MLADQSNAARSSVCRTLWGVKGEGLFPRLMLREKGGGVWCVGGIRVSFCSPVNNINIFFTDVFLVPALLWLPFPNTTSNRNDATEDIQCVVQ